MIIIIAAPISYPVDSATSELLLLTSQQTHYQPILVFRRTIPRLIADELELGVELEAAEEEEKEAELLEDEDEEVEVEVEVEVEELLPTPGINTVIPWTLNPFKVMFDPACCIASATLNICTCVALPGASSDITLIVVAFESRM